MPDRRNEDSRETSRAARVAILADTHGTLDARIAETVRGCDYALHAGDIGGRAVLAALAPRLATVAVRGNNDTPDRWPGAAEILARLPREADLDLPGGRVVLVHGDCAGSGRGRHERLRRTFGDARAIIYGHSHRLCVDVERLPWVLNPGAAGRVRTYGGPSCLVLVAGEGEWRVSVERFAPLGRSRAAARARAT